MIRLNDNICIIPARGGSKRIKKKNIKKFFDRPIITYVIKSLKKTRLFKEIIVSSDDNQILKIAKSSGAKIHLRDKNLANDFIGTIPVIKNVILDLLKEKKNFEKVCCVYPTSLFFSKKSLLQAFKKLDKKKDYIFTAAKFSHPIERSFFRHKKKLKMNFQSHYKTRTQNLKPSYYDAAQFYLGWKNSWLKEKNIFTGKNDFIEFDEFNFQDIDEKEDWSKAKIKWKLLKKKYLK